MIGRFTRDLPLPTGAFLVLAAAYVALKLVRPVIPGSVILLYMGFVLAGIVIHLTLTDGRIRRFRDFFVPAAGEGRSLTLHFIHAQRDAQYRVITRESAILAVVNAFVGKI